MKLIDLKIGDRFFLVNKSDLTRFGLEEQDQPFTMEEMPAAPWLPDYRVYSRTKAVVVLWDDDVDVRLVQ